MVKKNRSYCITLRPRLGLHGELSDALEATFKSFQYFAYVFELEDEKRHIHGQIWLDTASDVDSIRKKFYREMKKYLEPQGEWTKACQAVQSKGFKPAYNDDWAMTYIQKDGDHVDANIPEDTTPYYPTKAEQAEYMKKAVRTADAYYHALKNRWCEANPDYAQHQFTDVDIAKFYYNQMFTDKVIAVISDGRQRKQKANALFHYIYPNDLALDIVLTQERIDIYKLLKDN